MIEWGKCKPEDFKVQRQGEEIYESGINYIFPVNVYDKKTEELAFAKTVHLRADFYKQLRKRSDWKDKLQMILRNRVRDEILNRIHSGQVSIDDRVDLLTEEKEGL